jgi:hypothetical protein
VLYAATPETICRERLPGNRQTGKRYEVRDADFENVVAQFEPPGDGERVLQVDLAQSLDWVESIADLLPSKRYQSTD